MVKRRRRSMGQQGRRQISGSIDVVIKGTNDNKVAKKFQNNSQS
jgi:hypothetical protein